MADYVSDVPPEDGNHALSQKEKTTLAAFRSTYKFDKKPAPNFSCYDYQKNKYGRVCLLVHIEHQPAK